MLRLGCCATVISVSSLPAVAAAAVEMVMVTSPRLSAKMSLMRLGCFLTVASVACSAYGARLAWVLSVAVVMVVMAAWTQNLSSRPLVCAASVTQPHWKLKAGVVSSTVLLLLLLVGHSWGVSAQSCDGLLVCRQKLHERHVFPLGAAQLYQLPSVRAWNLAIATVLARCGRRPLCQGACRWPRRQAGLLSLRRAGRCPDSASTASTAQSQAESPNVVATRQMQSALVLARLLPSRRHV